MKNIKLDLALAREAKAIVALAFRNGPIESLHAGKRCPTCADDAGYSKITDAEMKAIMQNAVDRVYEFGVAKKTDPVRYKKLLTYGHDITREWDEPRAAVIRRHSTVKKKAAM